jgi:anti-sigma-K factor RskA
MNTMNQEAPERQEIEALLPWHAAGTLSRGDAERVERALSCDRELARRFDLVREELHETIHLNELLGHPSSRAADRLFAAIEAEGARAPARRSFDLAGRVAAFLSSLAPRTLARAAGAAAVVLLVQSAVMTSVLLPGSDNFILQSVPNTDGVSRIVVRFVPQATSADITKFLNTHKAELVGGPKDGNYTLRLAATGIPKEGLLNIVRQMQGETKIVDFVATKD